MSISMYQACVPGLIRTLGNLIAILEKAAAHAEAKKIDPSVLVGSRLSPDMFPLGRQVQIASDNAKGCAARLAGIEPPRYEDTESTFPELVARLKKTIAFLESLAPEQFEGAETRPITLQMRSGALNFVGLVYLTQYAIPNFYFHAVTAYDILRHCGVEIGKKDYLGSFA